MLHCKDYISFKILETTQMLITWSLISQNQIYKKINLTHKWIMRWIIVIMNLCLITIPSGCPKTIYMFNICFNSLSSLCLCVCVCAYKRMQINYKKNKKKNKLIQEFIHTQNNQMNKVCTVWERETERGADKCFGSQFKSLPIYIHINIIHEENRFSSCGL